MSRDVITHDVWDNVKIEHYGDDGKYLGYSYPTKDPWQNDAMDHYTSDGTYVGRTYKND